MSAANDNVTASPCILAAQHLSVQMAANLLAGFTQSKTANSAVCDLFGRNNDVAVDAKGEICSLSDQERFFCVVGPFLMREVFLIGNMAYPVGPEDLLLVKWFWLPRFVHTMLLEVEVNVE